MGRNCEEQPSTLQYVKQMVELRVDGGGEAANAVSEEEEEEEVSRFERRPLCVAHRNIGELMRSLLVWSYH